MLTEILRESIDSIGTRSACVEGQLFREVIIISTLDKVSPCMFSGRGVMQDTAYLTGPHGRNLLALKFEMIH